MDAEPLCAHDGLQIVYRVLGPAVFIDDDVVKLPDELYFRVRDLKPASDLFVGLRAAGFEPFAQMRESIRQEKDEHSVRKRRLNGERAVDLLAEVGTWRQVEAVAALSS